MTWSDVPDNAKCADCLLVIDVDEPCRHMIFRHDDALNRTYLYHNGISPCFCQCGVSLVNGFASSARMRREQETMPLYYIREAVDIGQPEGATRPTEVQCACGTYALPDAMITVSDAWSGRTYQLCATCRDRDYTQCGDCEQWIHSGHVFSVDPRSDTDSRVCRTCLGNYTGCSHCGRYTRNDASEACCEPDVFGVVPDCGCYECVRARTDVIHSYSYRPAPVFAGTPVLDRHGNDRTPYMGFELEVEVSRDGDLYAAATEVRNAGQGRIYLKEDGSIHNGFEIVTHPASLDWYLSEFPWQKIRDMRSERRIHSADNCGLHVHVSRAGFSGAPHEYRWFLFWYRNQSIMNLLAGRESTYAEYNPTHRSMFKEIATTSPTASAGRYAAINTTNGNTFEVRVFASTLYVNRIKAALQLVEGTTEYTRQLRSAKVLKDGGFSFDSFMEWMLATGPRRYAELIRRVEDVTRNRTFPRAVRSTDSWRTYDTYGRSRWVNRTLVTQEEKASR